jgi:glycerophosphoryl diester phosphodiesterase
VPVVTPGLIELAHEHRLQVHVWTVDDPTTISRLLRLGVDGIMSDRPDELLRALGQDAQPLPSRAG